MPLRAPHSFFRTSTLLGRQNPYFRSLRQPLTKRTITTRGTESAWVYRINVAAKFTIVFVGGGILGFYITDTRSAAHRYVAVPLLRFFVPDAEDAHVVGLKTLRGMWDYGVHPRDRAGERDELKAKTLETKIWDKTLVNPMYISAGLDKHAEAVDALFALGPSVVEIGCVTPEPQFGNPKPRVFRLERDNALINRYGFNSEGAFAVACRLRERVARFAVANGLTEQTVLDTVPASLIAGKLLAVQIGKNKDVSENDLEGVKQAYQTGVRTLGLYADVIVVNVSSPNTPGLRKLQGAASLTEILTAVVSEVNKLDKKLKPKVIVKISPDESNPQQISQIAQSIVKSKVDGVVVANTTLKRPKTLLSPYHLTNEAGGLSGPELYTPMVSLVKEYRKQLPDDKEVWASGGIDSGEKALNVLREGAGMVGVYTAMTYGGVGTIGRIKEEIRDIVKDYTKKSAPAAPALATTSTTSKSS